MMTYGTRIDYLTFSVVLCSFNVCMFDCRLLLFIIIFLFYYFFFFLYACVVWLF